MNDAYESALCLVKRGFVVFPLKPDRTPHIRGYTTKAASNADEVEGYWRTFPDAPGVGISNGLCDVVTFDIDPRHGGTDSLGRLLMEHGDEWLRTVTAKTQQGGDHLYFRADGQRFANTTGDDKKGVAPGIDTRAVGGYTVAPRSVGESGKYDWLRGYSPDDREMLPIPDWLAKILPRKRDERIYAPRDHCAAGPRHRSTDASNNIITCISPFSLATVTPEFIRDLDRDPAFVFAVAQFLEIPDVPVGTAFHCVFHQEDRPSAALFRMDSGHVHYHDFHSPGTPTEWLTLAEVFAAQVTGRIEKLPRPSYVTWKMRMLVAMGLLDLAPVEMLPLPESASNAARKVYEGFRLLLGCKWLYEHGAATTFTWRFAAGWCNVAQATAQQGLQELVRLGIVEQVGTHRASFGKEAAMYLPCR